MRSVLVLAAVFALVLAGSPSPSEAPVASSPSPTPVSSSLTSTPSSQSPAQHLPASEAFAQLVPIKGSTPSGRHNAAAGYNIDTNQFYVIGGANGTASTKDVWVYDLSANVWAQVPGAVADVYGAASAQAFKSKNVWIFGGVNSSGAPQNFISQFNLDDNKIVALPNSSPNANLSIATAGAAACVSNNEQWFHVFGGAPATQTCSNQLATFDVAKHSWMVWDVSAENASLAPPGRDGATIVDYNGLVFLFGGRCGNKTSPTDVWRFNYKTGNWSKDKVISKPPLARFDHIAFIDPTLPNPSMIIFGGMNSKGELLNDIWSYDLVKMSWSIMRPDSGVSPAPRKDTAGVYALGRFVFFGGTGEMSSLGDLWQFVHQADCFAFTTCQDCTQQSFGGCGWCWDNQKGYHCVSGAHGLPYLAGSCQGSPSSSAFNTDPLYCPSSRFPSWAIALIVIGGVVLIGIIVFAVMKMRKSNEYEEIQ